MEITDELRLTAAVSADQALKLKRRRKALSEVPEKSAFFLAVFKVHTELALYHFLRFFRDFFL